MTGYVTSGDQRCPVILAVVGWSQNQIVITTEPDCNYNSQHATCISHGPPVHGNWGWEAQFNVSNQIMEQLKTAFSCDERLWIPMYLHSRFSAKNLENLYKRYEQRYLLSNFTIYLFIQSLINFGIICLSLTVPNEYCYSGSTECRFPPYVYQLDISTHIVIMFTFLGLGFFVSVYEETIKRKPWTLYLFSIMSVAIIEVTDMVNIYFASKEEIEGIKVSNNNTLHHGSYSSYTLHNYVNSQAGAFSSVSSLDDSLSSQHPPHHLPVASLFNLIYVYLFLPISRKDVAVCLGMVVSVITISITAISKYFIDSEFVSKGDEGTAYGYQLAADVVFHICVNLIGWYVRYVGDINMRRGFLDKRGCIETTFRLKYEKEQEENLLLSIIPKHIASQVGEEVSQFISNLTNEGVTEKFSETFIEKHKNVSILYADICNFTPLTEKFTSKQIVNGKEVTVDRIEDLVATLNDLFGKFDEAADRHNCLRIKILGDCYYCISGLPIPDPNNKEAPPVCDPNHAKNSVQMGLDMIDLIKEVREEHGVPVNMRIGVHTGNVLSGLIGLRKWQFDIWSTDTTIANHMESSGQPGKVHITEKTKECLGSSFEYQDVVNMEDQVILDSGLKTYLIKTKEPVRPVKDKPKTVNVATIKEGEEDKSEIIGRQFSNDSGIGSNETGIGSNETLPRASRSVMIQDEPEIRTYERAPNTGRRGSSAVPMRRSSIGGQGGRRSSKMFSGERSNSVWSEDEKPGTRRKSIMMDSSLKGFKNMMDNTETFMEDEIEQLPIRMQDRWFSLKKRQADGKKTEVRNSNTQINHVFLFFKSTKWYTEYLKEHDPLFKWYILASFVILNGMGVILILTSFNTRPHVVLWILYMIIYTFLLVLIPCTWISFIWDQIIDPEFDLEHIEQPENRLIKAFYQASGAINTSFLYRNLIFVFIGVMTMLSSVLDLVITPCMLENPRNYTYRCALAIMVFFMFLRIPNIFKTLLCMLSLLFYWLIIFGFIGQHEDLQNPKTFFSSESFGYEIWTSKNSDRYQSHFAFLCGVFFYFLILDRQNEYIHLLDYQWKRQLKDDQAKARSTKLVNKMLLQNILPQHVADVYLSNNREAGKLFSESYQNVAVMFASLPNYIDFFSESDEKKPLNILHEIISKFDQLMYEVQFDRIEKIKIVGSTFMAACGLISGRKSSIDYENEEEAFTKGQNARTMTKFAAAMMRSLQEMDYEKFELKSVPDFQLRIGICAGKVIAGVVGAQKPLYDIWGDTVNIAARMDYTGDRGKIHIPEATAQQLMNLDKEGNEFEETNELPLLDPWVKCNYRGDIKVKGKGIMTTYYVELTEDNYLVEQNVDRKYSEDLRSVSRNNSYGFVSGQDMENESVHSSGGASGSTANVDEVEEAEEEKPSLSIEEQLKKLRNNYGAFSRDSEENDHIEQTNVNSPPTDISVSSINSSRSNSGMSSCHSTDTSSVLMNLGRQEQTDDLKGVTDYDISQLREWLDCNKLD